MSFVEGNNVIDCVIPQLMLSAGKYQMGAALAVPTVEYLCDGLDYGSLEVAPKDVFNSGLSPHSGRSLIPMDYRWQPVSPVSSCSCYEPAGPLFRELTNAESKNYPEYGPCNKADARKSWYLGRRAICF